SNLLQGVFHAPARKEEDGSLAISANNSDIAVMTPTQFDCCFGWSPVLHGRGLRLAGLVFSVASLYAVEQLLVRNGIVFTKSENRICVTPAPGQGTLFVFEGSKS